MKKKKSAKKRPKPKASRPKKARVAKKAGAQKKVRAQKNSPIRKRPQRTTVAAPARNRAASSEFTQSGDDQGLSDRVGAGFESVKELADEGQYLEAEVVEGVEDAGDDAARPLKTREVPEDDVPEEYQVDDNRDRQS